MRWLLLFILLGFCALTTLYNLSVPLGEGPDEPGHLRYALFLAREGRLPVQRAYPEISDVPGEGHQPPLVYLFMVPGVAWLPDDVSIAQTANPQFRWAGGDQPGAFMRGSWELERAQGLAFAWHLARGVSAAWALIAVLATYLAARTLYDPQMMDEGRKTKDGRSTRRSGMFVPVFAAALVAFNPQFLFSSALVTNDTALAAFGAILLWLCLRAVAQRDSRRQLGAFVLIGVLFGLALLTKQSALLIGPLLLWAGWRAAYGCWRLVLMHTLAWSLPALLVAGWWFIRNWQLYGDLFGLAIFSAEFAGQPFRWYELAAWIAALRQLFESFWGRFGWMSLSMPPWINWIYALLCGVALIELVLRRQRADAGRPSTDDRRQTADGGRRINIQPVRKQHRPWEGLVLLSGMALLWTVAFAFTAGLVAWQGRMLFPAISALAIGLAVGLTRLGSLRWVVGGLTVGVFALALYVPLGVIRPAYPWVALAPAQAQTALGTPTYARFAEPWEQGVELRGWRLDGPAIVGTDLPLTLTWHSLAYIPKNWTIFLHLVAADGSLVAMRNSDPQNGTLPMPLWTPGDWIADPHVLALPPDLPPGRYELRIGLYRAETDGRRSAVWNSAGALIGDYVALGAVEVEQ